MASRIDVRNSDRDRLPPGQILTRKWPVLHYDTVPRVDLATRRFDYPGFWEQNGYHRRGDRWQEERYGRADHARMRRGPRNP